jgi:hypothetical protein
VEIKAGKIGAEFAFAYDQMPGVFGDLLIDDLEINERLGGSVEWEIADGPSGEYTVSAALFTADTTFLSESFLHNRGRNEADGSPGNTGSLENFTVALTAEDAFGAEGLFLRLGYLVQNGDDGAFIEDQKAFVIGGSWEIEAGKDLTVMPLVEYVKAEFGGFGGFDQDWLTIGLAVMPGDWTVTGAFKSLETDFGAGFGETANIWQLSAGYAFENGLGLGVGYAHRTDDFGFGGFDSSVIGFQLTYCTAFGGAEC